MNDITNSITVDGEETCRQAVDFFKSIGYLSIPCDEILDGTKGFFLLKDGSPEDQEFIVKWRFGSPIQNQHLIPREIMEESITECIKDIGWIICDDVKSLRIGFANFEKSECRFFRLTDLKAMPKDLQESYLTRRGQYSADIVKCSFE